MEQTGNHNNANEEGDDENEDSPRSFQIISHADCRRILDQCDVDNHNEFCAYIDGLDISAGTINNRNDEEGYDFDLYCTKQNLRMRDCNIKLDVSIIDFSDDRIILAASLFHPQFDRGGLTRSLNAAVTVRPPFDNLVFYRSKGFAVPYYHAACDENIVRMHAARPEMWERVSFTYFNSDSINEVADFVNGHRYYAVSSNAISSSSNAISASTSSSASSVTSTNFGLNGVSEGGASTANADERKTPTAITIDALNIKTYDDVIKLYENGTKDWLPMTLWKGYHSVNYQRLLQYYCYAKTENVISTHSIDKREVVDKASQSRKRTYEESLPTDSEGTATKKISWKDYAEHLRPNQIVQS